ncbi:MAG: efflux RND transporter permease subunit [Desulfovermiculus sp.]|nr:efflux RND transporter permease subunit [Desulfovermiculus sp.]
MHFTDIFIRRPVLATVVSLLILLLGARSLQLLNVREYPETSNAQVTVLTPYVGADADLVKGFVTTPLEKEIAGVDGIDYLQSTSVQGISSITANLSLNYDPYQALTQITSKVNKVRNQLPEGSEDPIIDISVGESSSSMYISFFSDILEANQVTDYLTRVVQPQLLSVQGIQSAEILGSRTFAMRIWLKPEKMAALGVTPVDVYQVLQANNYLSAIGSTKGSMISINLSATTNIHTAEQFRRLAVKEDGEAIIRIEDIADVVLGAENYDVQVSFDGTSATFIGVNVLPTANPLTVIQGVRKILPDIESQLPQGLEMAVPYDATEYIQDAIYEVEKTILEALAIVILVIFLFLGSVRSVIIPAVAMPLSLVGAGLFMLLMGFSINLLTLLAMVLAIGLVVDDAIIVTENIHRHIEEGLSPFQAAIKGARELSTAVITMTITLVSVYAPIGFMQGLTGTLFTEFAFTLAGAVVISGIVALTLSPMMCSKILRPARKDKKYGLVNVLDRLFERIKRIYLRLLNGCLRSLPAMAVFAVGVLVSCYFLFAQAQKELAPTEDKGLVLVSSTAAPTANIDQTAAYTDILYADLAAFPETHHVFMISGAGGGGGVSASNSAFAGLAMRPWSERERSQMDLQPLVQERVSQIAGLDSVAFNLPALPGSSGGLPVQFVMKSTQEPEQMKDISDQLLQRAMQSGLFVYADTDLKFDLPRMDVHIDRDKVTDLGLTMQDVGNSLGILIGDNYVNRFSIQGRSYKVIPQVVRSKRLNPDQLENYYLRTAGGEMVALSTVVSLEKTVQPRQLSRFQQLNSATISGVPAPGVAMGQALEYLQTQAEELFPKGYLADYSGQSRQYVQEGQALIFTFFLAIMIIFLVLSAQYESFRDPLIIMVSVPMSISGALIFLTLGLATVNIYTQVGLITLIGLISKHGILIVEFANQLQRQGMDKAAAVAEAAGIRLRPILMTTFSTIMGVFPLIIASGPGAVSRFNIGLVVFTGMLIGTLFTLFVVPPMYVLLSKNKTQTQGSLHHGTDTPIA